MTPDPLLERLREIITGYVDGDREEALEAELRALLADVAIEEASAWHRAFDDTAALQRRARDIRARFGVSEKP